MRPYAQPQFIPQLSKKKHFYFKTKNKMKKKKIFRERISMFVNLYAKTFLIFNSFFFFKKQKIQFQTKLEFEYRKTVEIAKSMQKNIFFIVPILENGKPYYYDVQFNFFFTYF